MNVWLYMSQHLSFCCRDAFQFDPVTIGYCDDNRPGKKAIGTAQYVGFSVAIGKTEVEPFTVTSRRAAHERFAVIVIHGDQEKPVINREFMFVNEHPQPARL